MTEYNIELQPDGSFECNHDQIFKIKAFDKISFYLDSKFHQIYRPMLLTSYPRKIGNKIQYPECQEITKEQVLKDPILTQKYNVFEGSWNREYQWQCDIQIADFNGTFFCQIIFVDYKDNLSKPLTLNIRKFAKPQYIVIQPKISINNQPVLLEQLIMQTVLPYSLGNINRWNQILQSQTNLGYNSFHFLPLQKLGSSNSMYSIKDQLVLNPEIIPNNDYSQLENIIQVIEKQMGALSFIDIILNHTSYDSEWIQDIPDAVYNSENTPLLTSAIELDEKLQSFSDKMANQEIQGYYKGNRVETEEDLDQLLNIMRKLVFEELKLWEYFQFNKKTVFLQFMSEIKERKLVIAQFNEDIDDEDDTDFFSKEPHQKLVEILMKSYSNCGAERDGVQLNLSGIFKELISKPFSYSIQSFQQALDILYENITQEGKQITDICIKNIRQYILQHRIHQKDFIVKHAPNSLIPRYFTKLNNGTFAANNGYINGDDTLENFAESESLPYLKRKITIWGDLLKLRYGKSKKDCPELWKRMRKYIRQMAKVFHGFRLDNAHSTPLHVGQYFMRKARNVNKDIIIFAELFTQDKEKDALFCKRFGINALVRETFYQSKAEEAIRELHWLNGGNENTVGSLGPMHKIDQWTKKDKVILKPTFPNNIVYDQSHDNPSVLQQYGIHQTLANVGIHSFANFFQGTIRGYDELLKEQLSVVNEKRLYPINDKYEINYIHESKVGFLYIREKQKQKNPISTVELKGSWDGWQNTVVLKNIGQQTFYAVVDLPLDKIENYEYKYIVDGNWMIDDTKPKNEQNNVFQYKEDNNRALIYPNLCQMRKKCTLIAKKLADKYPESFIQYHGNQVVSIIRQSQKKYKSYFQVSRFGFEADKRSSELNLQIQCPGIMGKVKHIFFVPQGGNVEQFYNNNNSNNINGESNQFLQFGQGKVQETENWREFMDIYYDEKQKKTVLHLFNIPPGFVMIIKCTLVLDQLQAVSKLNKIFKDLSNPYIEEKFQKLTPFDINYLLYKSAAEEEIINGKLPYQIPDHYTLPFAGFAGLFHEVLEASKYNSLNTKLFDNIREGDWLLEYLLERIKLGGENFSDIHSFLEEVINLMKKVQRYNIPYYFCKLMRAIRMHTSNNILKRVKLPLENYLFSNFHKMLLNASYQFISRITIVQDFEEKKILNMTSGLPRYPFMTGRDVFISFKGCLLIPGLYSEAQELIIYFGSFMRHGLLPSKIDNKGKARYNARDVCWWFIKAIKDYIEFTQDYSILDKPIEMEYLSNDQETHNNKKSLNFKKIMKLHQIIMEIFQSHMTGIKFTEWDAGRYLDPDMDSLGFHINLCYDESNGFITGGNAKNALTWMNQIGTSKKASNRGIPASPRDGAPIELTALLWNCLNFAQMLVNNHISNFPHQGLKKKNGDLFKFSDWADQIQENFFMLYCLPANKSKTMGQQQNQQQTQNKKANKVKRRKYGFYKDTILSSNEEQEYQLRPNGCIAISLAPELFMSDKDKDIKKWTLQYLASVEFLLIEPKSLGVKTLEQEDSLYVGNYDEADTFDSKSSRGYNLYNGIEWVFLYGFFLKAMMFMNLDSVYNNQRIMSYLTFHKQYLNNTIWQSFPGITNKNGQYCPHSCPSRSMSVAQIQEVCYELSNNDYLNELKDKVTSLNRWVQSSRDMEIFWIKKTSSTGNQNSIPPFQIQSHKSENIVKTSQKIDH